MAAFLVASMTRRLCLVVLLCGSLSIAVIPNGYSQLCGERFAKLRVTDSNEKQVSKVTIELIAKLPRTEYVAFSRIRGGDGSVNAVNYRLSSTEYADLLKLSVPLNRSTDICGNPLKQEANQTPLFTISRGSEAVDTRKASVKKFGFCTSENDQSVILLTIYAQGYAPGYYLGTYLGGCTSSYSFVLSKRRR